MQTARKSEYNIERKRRLGLYKPCWVNGCQEPKEPGRGVKYCKKHRAEAAERHRIQKGQYGNAWKKRKRAEARVSKPPKLIQRPVPMEVRDAYRVAKPNSIIRQKYPTWKDLERAYAA